MVYMQLKEVKVMMYFHISNMEELKTREEIADFITNMIYEDPAFFGRIDEENVLDVREYEVPVIEYGDNIV